METFVKNPRGATIKTKQLKEGTGLSEILKILSVNYDNILYFFLFRTQFSKICRTFFNGTVIFKAPLPETHLAVLISKSIAQSFF